jgi:hypothetical protein
MGDNISGREMELNVQQSSAMDDLDAHCPSVMVDVRVLQRNSMFNSPVPWMTLMNIVLQSWLMPGFCGEALIHVHEARGLRGII